MAHRERRVVSATPIPDERGLMQDGLPREFWVRVVNFAELDDFGTKFDRGAFKEYLDRRMPRFLYGHNWSDPTALVGKGVESRASAEGLDVKFQLDDFQYVPVARQIAYQVKNGTLDQFSVDFVRLNDRRDAQGVVWITKARLPAVSGVPEGAVPGTRVLTRAVSMAGSGSTIALSDALNVLTHLALGELDLPDALAQLKEASMLDQEDDDDGAPKPEIEDPPLEGVPVVEEGTPAPDAPEGAHDPTEVNGDTSEGKAGEAPSAEDQEALAALDDALGLINGRV